MCGKIVGCQRKNICIVLINTRNGKIGVGQVAVTGAVTHHRLRLYRCARLSQSGADNLGIYAALSALIGRSFFVWIIVEVL